MRIKRYSNLREMMGAIEPHMENFSIKESAALHDTDYVSIVDTFGWHVYARLRVDANLVKSDAAEDERKLLGILCRYTDAARKIVESFGDVAVLLEHQGEILHFYLSIDKSCVFDLEAFCSGLASCVKYEVLPSDGVYGFSIAAQFGRSVILHVPSANHEESAYSRVSLGPCANSPAKKVICNGNNEDWTLNYRTVDAGDWVKKKLSLQMDRKAVLENFCEKQALTLEIEAKMKPVTRYGYVFRADQDGFTDKVKNAFDRNTGEAIDVLVSDFVSFMNAINNWQRSSVIAADIVSMPWAGDCCSMFLTPYASGGKSEATVAREAISRFPIEVLRAWEQFKTANANNTTFRWSYGMAEGRMRVFIRELEGRRYRLFVGWPVAISLEAVNLKQNDPEDLVMHEEDVRDMTDLLKSSFSRISTSDYYVQSGPMREQLKINIIKRTGDAAKETLFAGIHVQPSRPYSM